VHLAHTAAARYSPEARARVVAEQIGVGGLPPGGANAPLIAPVVTDRVTGDGYFL